ncbi:hypothetical protein [Kocuria marina]|uniref:hypothetical protein n=1 Tax=Kocuria marina TaxID=223184 RepID=UPI0022E374BD|nr:hypothetical protein [Kocuria marina]
METKAQLLSFGNFGAKMTRAADRALFLKPSPVVGSARYTRPEPHAEDGVAVCAGPQK